MIVHDLIIVLHYLVGGDGHNQEIFLKYSINLAIL